MPLDTIYVERIDPTDTCRPGVVRFLITGRHAEADRLGSWQGTTTNQWAASVCQRAKDIQQPVAVAWQRIGPWQNIVSVDFV